MVSCADKIMRLTIDTYFEPNRTIGKLRDLIKSETNIDPLKEFQRIGARRTGSIHFVIASL